MKAPEIQPKKSSYEPVLKSHFLSGDDKEWDRWWPQVDMKLRLGICGLLDGRSYTQEVLRETCMNCTNVAAYVNQKTYANRQNQVEARSCAREIDLLLAELGGKALGMHTLEAMCREFKSINFIDDQERDPDPDRMLYDQR